MRNGRLLVPLMIVTACGNTADSVAEKLAAPSAPPAREARASSAQGSAAAAFAAQKLIRASELRIGVKDVTSAVSLTDSVARAHGGLLADSRLSEDGQGRHQAQLVIRVPSDRFATAVADLRRLGDVKNESVNTQDVTKAYADLATRITVKEQTVARLRSLVENRTAKLTDVLEVERELDRSVTELEQLKGEQRYYDRQVALSSISITVFDRVGSTGTRFTETITSAFAGSLEVLGNSLGSLIYVLVFLLPWGAIAAALYWIAIRLRVRRPIVNAAVGTDQ
jgi:hypothetical protein